MEDALEELAACWEGLKDTRSGNAALRDFHELLMIALCPVLSGGQHAADMATFTKAKEPFLRGSRKLANGLPSHETFSGQFRLLDSVQFGAAFRRSRPLLCSTATRTSFGAQQPTGRTASPNITTSSAGSWLSTSSYFSMNAACFTGSDLREIAVVWRYSMPSRCSRATSPERPW
jgi:hypothetical protein